MLFAEALIITLFGRIIPHQSEDDVGFANSVCAPKTKKEFWRMILRIDQLEGQFHEHDGYK